MYVCMYVYRESEREGGREGERATYLRKGDNQCRKQKEKFIKIKAKTKRCGLKTNIGASSPALFFART